MNYSSEEEVEKELLAERRKQQNYLLELYKSGLQEYRESGEEDTDVYMQVWMIKQFAAIYAAMELRQRINSILIESLQNSVSALEEAALTRRHTQD